MRELRGKRVAVGTPESGTRALALTLLKANAVEWRNGQWIGGADRRSEGAALKE